MTYDKQHRKNPIGSNVIHAGYSDFNWKNPRSPEYLVGNFNDVNCWQLDSDADTNLYQTAVRTNLPQTLSC
jgi:hypothetical protein